VLEKLLIAPARRRPDLRFVVAGPQYPDADWPDNVERIEHLPPAEHARFYSSLRWTLNLTRADMVAAGYSPSVRLFEAAACGTPIVSDSWPGLDSILRIGSEVVVADTGEDVLGCLAWPEQARAALAASARQRVLAEHTSAHRAAELELMVRGTMGRKLSRAARSVAAA
jgi:spore maturation protein CgeB